MRNIEIKKIQIGSVFKLCFIGGAVLGLILGILVLVMGSFAQTLGLPLANTHFETGGALQIGASILGVLIGCLAYGVVNSIFGIIGAFIYNLFAAIVGGIVLKVEE
jgi:lipopolysaccharide export LptBFGC system permease protein LptF